MAQLKWPNLSRNAKKNFYYYVKFHTAVKTLSVKNFTIFFHYEGFPYATMGHSGLI